MKKIKFILVNDKAAEPRFNGPKAQFKVQCGKAAVQGSRFSDQGQSDPRVDDKDQGSRRRRRGSRFSDQGQSDPRVDDKVL